MNLGVINAQPNPQLPTILPPTPEAASITKNAELTFGGYHGGAHASIPLYQIKMGDFILPIGLNYASNGFKVDEIPSRVGLGFSLNAGGVITRIVNGRPDDLTTRIYPSQAIAYTHPTLDFLYNLTYNSSVYDSEPDEFRIAAPGMSGKFVIDTGNHVVLIPYSNMKVQVDESYSEIVVTNTEGIKFYFGGSGAVEVTTNHNIEGKLSGFTQINTGFFLRKIEFLNRDSINFYYSVLGIRNITGVTHTAIEGIGLWSGGAYCPGLPSCGYGSSTFSESFSDVTYNSRLLDSIKASSGAKITFQYANRPDNGGDKRLTGVIIYEGSNLKKYNLSYYDPLQGDGLSAYNKRFFLKELKYWVEKEGYNSIDTLKHKLEYTDIDNLPTRLSSSQDAYGFYNGSPNQTLLPIGYSETNFGNYALANRRPNGQAAKKAMLNKIIYPTGGYDSIIYESHQYTDSAVVIYPANGTVGGQGSGSMGIVTHYSSNIVTQRDNGARLFITAAIAPTCSSCTPPEEGVDIIVDVYLKNLTDNTSIRRILRNFTYTDEVITLLGGKTYQIELKVRGDYVDGFVELQYDDEDHDIYATQGLDGPGVRVREFISSDGVTNKPVHKYYKYAPVNNLNLNSGLPLYEPIYTSLAYQMSLNCDDFFNNRVCYSSVLSSNSNAAQYYYDNNAYVYTKILESNDPTFKNGVIEHVYAAEGLAGYSTTLMGDDIFQMPANTYTWHHGYELATNYYDSTLTLKKSVNNYYHEDTAVNKMVRGISVRAKYYLNQPESSETLGQIHIDPWDVGEYYYHSQWIQHDSTVMKEYDDLGHMISSKSTYYYGTPVNTLPSRTEILDSKGYVLKEEFKYPTDSSAVAPYQRMVNNNIISPAIQTKSYRNNNLTYTLDNNYYDYSEGTSSGYPIIIKPKTIQVKKGSANSETRIRFYKYDTKGNAIELSKENDMKLVYIWDYKRDYPIAEISNADSASVAYTSFEADGKGGWTYSGTVSTDNTTPTGNNRYSLTTTNTITKSNLTSALYTVSYWSKNGAYAVNSGSPTIAGRSVNGWTYYEHEVTSTSVTISGNGYVDEVRLYLKGALMKTYTYTPLIGVTAQCDVNNTITYYEYDGFGRLSLVRDQNKNILKKICYNYAGLPEECSVPVYRNVVKTGTYTRNNCSSGYAAGTATYTVPASTYSSIISQDYVDSVAQADVNANGQTYANANGSCSLIYYNAPKSGNFTRNNCGSGYTGSTVTYTVSANTYSSTIGPLYVDSLAQANVNANGQTYANTNGTCTASTTIYARIEYADMYYDVTEIWATVLIKFYSNSACTTPVSVSGLTVNYRGVKYLCVGGTSIDTYSTSCTGTQKSLGTFRIQWDDTGDGGSHCWDYLFNTTSGSGYVPAN